MMYNKPKRLMSNFEKKLAIKGTVLCCCGGVIINENGDLYLAEINNNIDTRLRCSVCNRTWDADFVLNYREEGETITLPKKRSIK